MAARPLDEVLAAFEAAHAAAAPVFTMADIVADPHYRAREAVVDVDGVPMQGLVARLSATPGRIRWAGRPEDADRAEDPRSELGRARVVGAQSSGTVATSMRSWRQSRAAVRARWACSTIWPESKACAG